MSVIVIAFTSLDGVVEDPDGSAGTDLGGWMFRYGREPVAGDKFRLGRLLDDGVLLLGRARQMSRVWSRRQWPSSSSSTSRSSSLHALTEEVEAARR